MADRKPRATGLGPAYELLAKAHCLGVIPYMGSLATLYQQDTLRCLAKCKEERDLFLNEQGTYDDLQFWYRSLVRTFFSQVEGVTFLMRQAAAWAAERGDFALDEKAVNKLVERRFDKSGRERIAWNSIEENVKLAFRHFPLIFGLDDWESPVTRDPHRWEEFLYAAGIRHGLMHPKGTDDFLIPAEALPRLESAMLWFAEDAEVLFGLCEEQAIASLASGADRLPTRLRRQMGKVASRFQRARVLGVATDEGGLVMKKVEKDLAKVLPHLRRYIPNCRG